MGALDPDLHGAAVEHISYMLVLNITYHLYYFLPSKKYIEINPVAPKIYKIISPGDIPNNSANKDIGKDMKFGQLSNV